jgi:hypothetical protein
MEYAMSLNPYGAAHYPIRVIRAIRVLFHNLSLALLYFFTFPA